VGEVVGNKMHDQTLTDKILAKSVLLLVPKWLRPNIFTWFRFISIPFVIWLLLYKHLGYGLILFIISAFSDAIDGSLARTRNQVTEWGKTFDPLADKLLIGSATIIVVSKYINVYLAATVVIIELFLIAGAYYRLKALGMPIQAEMSGKVKMVLQSLGLGSLLVSVIFNLPVMLVIATYLLYVSIVFAIISLVVHKSI